MSQYFDSFNFEAFWDNSEYALKEYVGSAFDDNTVEAVEKKLGYKLPASYIEFLRHQNGSMPAKSCCPTTEDSSWASDHVAIRGFFSISTSKGNTLVESGPFMIDAWEYPDIGVYICDCPSAGHDMIALDYTECGNKGEPRVVHVDQESDFKIIVLAKNFEAFVKMLLPESHYH